jgi:hypothetical protein
MKITLLRSACIYGKMMHAGDDLDCPDKEAKLWLALAWAREKHDDVEEEKEESGFTEEGPGSGRKRTYRRRDLRAG